MTYEELIAENQRLRERIRELEQENARLKGLDAQCYPNRKRRCMGFVGQ